MGAYSYKIGVAKVNYKWDIYPSDCCMGITRCTGEFETPVRQNAVEVVGDIPPGKIDIEIRLTAKTDVDVQVYDLEDKSTFPEQGEAVVAWAACGEKSKTCNAGYLLGQHEESYTYKDLEYIYSGYNGINKNLGDEAIEIKGTSNTNLRMTVFGYKSSKSATVTYSYMNPVPEIDDESVRSRHGEMRSSSSSGQDVHTRARDTRGRGRRSRSRKATP